ncbi:PTS system, galactitol-specific IIA component [Enterococcus malodoratus]|uniref:PTS sugar transporter subunit IIA n=1 Tax=Enterococcus malodoratus TaxID=71451 RepID=UPI0008ACBBD3|nr:PTS sugar transporter subunit IIA [Enterococcus malodoratus]SET76362.1 PTS system, galactitol-specific IIA component [Enterococcus malodoratus]
MISKDFMYCQYTVENKEELFDQLSDALKQKGIVKDGFAQALKDREKDFPTGLPVKHGVAIPHTDGSLVNSDQLIFATLTKPVVFNEMGGDDEDIIDVSVIVMLAVKDGPKHLDVLQKLIESIQKEGFIDSLAAANETEEMFEIVNNYLYL